MDTSLIPSNLTLFLSAVLVLILTPGPVVLYIITRSVNQGTRAGLVSVVGLELGNFCHVIAAAFGLTAILLSSALLFDVVKYAGAGYLVYLGARKLLSSEEVQEKAVAPDPLSRIFSQGIVVAILNPKTALFFFAFFPQFIDPSKGHVVAQILLLGSIMVIMATVTDSVWALTTGSLGRWLRGNLRYLRAERYVSGFVYIGLGLSAALAGNGRK